MPESSRRAVPIETTAAQTGLIFMVIFPFEVRTWRIGEVNRVID